jgi:hypothetical protein
LRAASDGIAAAMGPARRMSRRLDSIAHRNRTRGRGIVAMKHLQFAVLATAVLGLISIFALPFIGEGEIKLTMWDLRILDPGQVFLTLGAFAVPLIIGILAMAKKGMARWHGIVAAVFFALAVVKCRENFSLATGAKLMLIAAVVGLLVSIVAIVKPAAPARG